jgi:hypothetical protein
MIMAKEEAATAGMSMSRNSQPDLDSPLRIVAVTPRTTLDPNQKPQRQRRGLTKLQTNPTPEPNRIGKSSFIMQPF